MNGFGIVHAMIGTFAFHSKSEQRTLANPLPYNLVHRARESPKTRHTASISKRAQRAKTFPICVVLPTAAAVAIRSSSSGECVALPFAALQN
jgi:hypothetical protein